MFEDSCIYVYANIRCLNISYDPEKSRRNIDRRGLSFELVHGFGWSSACVREDTRKDYGEERFRALGEIEGRIHMVVFTFRGENVHIISLRKANHREVKSYDEEKEIRRHL